METNEGAQSITTEDIERGFHAAREPVSQNLHRALKDNILDGFMTVSKEKKDGRRA